MAPDQFSLAAGAVLSAIAAILFRCALPNRRLPFYVFKPLTTCLILALAILAASRSWSGYGIAIALGVLFSLIGDIWLMLPGDRLIPALVSFLFAHLSYCYGFASTLNLVGFPWPALPLLVFGGLMLRYLWPGLQPHLRVPVSVYVLVIVAMASLACSRALANPSIRLLAAASGALAFLISDTLLAVDRFRRSFRLAEAAVLGTYYAAQLLIALSVAG